MARVKLSEYAAKKLLVDSYHGFAIYISSLEEDIEKLDSKQKYIIKVDQGIKKRGKQGLIKLDVTKKDAKMAIEELVKLGAYERFIAEPMMPHDESEERYVSFDRVRGGYRVLYSPRGGVEIEEHQAEVERYNTIEQVPLPQDFLKHVTDVMTREHLGFVEINPLVVREQDCVLLDAAVLADSSGEWQASWGENDVVEVKQKVQSEQIIEDLNNNSPASFSFRLLNPNGAIWLLLSGGGASITIADEAANRKRAHLIGNYGEYSGGPTREETQLYTEAVLEQMFASSAPVKALIIAGGVANFTDVKKTFGGVIDALTKYLNILQEARVKVYVRRGGPNEKEGLRMMKDFLDRHDILGSIHGSEAVLTAVVDEALEYVDA
jgi:succinyl-CoA synthetase beta subunit